MRARETWERKGQYAIVRGPWAIAKVFIDGATLYVLTHDNGVRYGHYETAEDAKAMAESVEAAT